MTGRRVFSHSSFSSGASRSGPSEQFSPIASAPRPSSVRAMEATVQPVKVRPPASKDMVTNTGRWAASLAASRAALASYRSVMVSTTIKSAPAFAPASAISRNRSYARSKDSVPIGSNSSPSGPTSSATRVPVPAAAFFATAMAAPTTSSTLWPVLASFKPLAPKVLA